MRSAGARRSRSCSSAADTPGSKRSASSRTSRATRSRPTRAPCRRHALGPRRRRAEDPSRAGTGARRLCRRAAGRTRHRGARSKRGSSRSRTGSCACPTDGPSPPTRSCGRPGCALTARARLRVFPSTTAGRVRADEYLRVEGVRGRVGRGRRGGGPGPHDRRDHAADGAARDAAGTTAGEEPHRVDSRAGASSRSCTATSAPSARSAGTRGSRVIWGVKLRGFPAWFAHRSYHLYAMPTLTRKAKIAADWTVALLFPRDLAQLGSLEHPRGAVRTRGGRAERRYLRCG